MYKLEQLSIFFQISQIVSKFGEMKYVGGNYIFPITGWVLSLVTNLNLWKYWINFIKICFTF